MNPLTIMGNRQRRDCHFHLIDEKPRWQRHNVARENELAMNLRGEMRDGMEVREIILSVENA